MERLSVRRADIVAGLVVVAWTCVAYLGSFAGRFVLDDRFEILRNPHLRPPASLWRAMFTGHELPARPLPYLSFAIDHAAWGPRPLGYHVTNLAIHCVAALALFAFARLSLGSPRLRDACGGQATVLAAIIAIVWAVHPLDTQAVTYVYQRIESMTGMFCLLALAAFARAAAGSPTGAPGSLERRWLAASVAAAAAAMACKENAVVLPLLVASYAWLVLGDDVAAFRRRLPYWAALSATWLVLGLHMAAQAGKFQEFEGMPHTAVEYALTQPRVILHYLRLAFWPVGLCFDLPWPISRSWREIVPSLVYLLVIVAVVLRGVVLRRPWSWLGVAFLVALSPTSSIMPVAAVAAEHRMYLPLAAVVAAAVLAVHALIRRRVTPPRRPFALAVAAVAAVVVAAWLALLTHERNLLYAAPGGIWLDVLRQSPVNTRALWNLADVCQEFGDLDAALAYADRVAELNPRLAVFESLVAWREEAGDATGADRVRRHAAATKERLSGAAAPAAIPAPAPPPSLPPR